MFENSTAAHVAASPSAAESAPVDPTAPIAAMARQSPGEWDLEEEAVYFSRRAREELHAGVNGSSRKAREVHIQIAQAYEFRAHLLNQELGRRGAAEQCYAL